MRITVNRIAELADVSRGTVDRVIHNRPGVKENVREKILEIIEALNYTPNLAGKALVSQNKSIKFGVVLAPDFHPFVDELKKGIKEETEQIKTFGVEVEIEVIKTLNAGEQLDILNNLEQRNVSGIAIVPVVEDVISSRLNELVSCGIPVVTFNSDIENTNRLCYIGQDNIKAGRTACGLMELILEAGSEILIVASSMDLECHRHRISGFQSRLAQSGHGLRVLGIEINQDEDDLTFGIVRKYCDLFPGLKGIYLTGAGAGGLGEALKVSGKDKTVKVISHDIVPKVEELMREGIIKFTIGQNPVKQGSLSIKVLFDYMFRKKKPEQEIIFTGIDIRTAENL